jgi:hypothetical protein
MLVGVGRWSELDALVRSAWSRRGALPRVKRAQLAAAFSAHLFWTGSLGQALTVARDELARLEECGGLDDAGVLLREAAVIAWFKGDGASALAYADRAMDVARRTGDLDLEIRAGRLEIVIGHGKEGEPQVPIGRLRENAAVARTQGLAISEGWALLYLALISGTLHDVETASQVSERAGAWFWVAALHEAALHLMEGRRDLSEAIFRQIRHQARQGVPTIAVWVDAKEACLYLHRGDLDEARRLLTGSHSARDACSAGLIGAE